MRTQLQFHNRFYDMAADKYPEFDSGFFSKYTTLEHYLNKGAFGIVYGPIPWHDKQVAIKQVMLAQGKATDDCKKGMEEKQQIWTSLEHKNIMRIHSVDLTELPKAMFIVMEYAAGGSVTETLKSLRHGNKLPIAVVTNWAKQIAEGMLYLHERNIVHRDLKPSNILLMEPYNACKTDATVTLKIADFDDLKEHDHTTTVSFVGTCAYMAPEFLKTERFSKACDVWSFGVVIWEMLSGDIPYKDLDPATILDKVFKGELNKLIIEQSFREDYQLLIKGCWRSESNTRLSFYDIFYVLHRMVEDKDVVQILKYKENMLQKDFPDDPGDIYKKAKKLIGTIRTKAVKESNKWINGLTILDSELFVVTAETSEVEVYDSINYSFSRRWRLNALNNPTDIGSCSRNKCLYISNNKGSMHSTEILKADPNGNLIKIWSTGKYGWNLSVTNESNVLLTVHNGNKLNEYSPDGKLIREINLSGVDIRFVWHALKLSNGHFVVSHGYGDDDLHRVCIVDADGKLKRSFGGKCGSNIEQMNRPIYLSVDRNGFIFVVDRRNHRVLLLDSKLELKRQILTRKIYEFQNPWRIFLDEFTNRALVAESDWHGPAPIKIFQF